MEINFYNFKKLMSLTAQLDINLESIRLKASAVSTVIDEGEIFEANLNEKKDPRVNFLYDTTINVLVPNPDPNSSPSTIESIRIKGTEVTDLYDSNGNELIQYPPNYAPAKLQVSNLSNPPTPPYIDIKIKPAHEFMQDKVGDPIDPAVTRKILYDRIWLAACGLWDNKNNKLSNFVKKISQSTSITEPTPGNSIPDSFGLSSPSILRDNKDIPWITIKNFKKKVKDLREKLVPKGLDVIVTIYEKSLDENGKDLNETFISRKKQKKYSDIAPYYTEKFITKRDLTPIPSDEISPFDVSIQSVQNIISDDSESLFSELIDIMNDIYDTQRNNPDTLTNPVAGEFISNNVNNKDIPKKITDLKTLIKSVLSNPASDNDDRLSHDNRSEFNNNAARLYSIQERIIWFEFFNGISINNSLNSVITGKAITNYFTYKKLARILIPIDMGIKVTKKRKKILGVSYPRRYKYTREDMGIRFAEVRFVNTSILQKYRKNEDPSGFPQVDSSGNPIIEKNPETGEDQQVVVDYAATKPDPLPTDVIVKYEMPHLPFDTELRKMALEQFGFFDHSINANTDNIYDTTNGSIIFDVDKNIVNKDIFDAHGNLLIKEGTSIPSGYEMFLNTSKNISDMRGGLDIYNKVQFLMTLLQDSFGNHRVKLIETNRSVEDQDKLQLGGASSNFLSWHNYGLSVKILITDESDTNTIKEGSPDFMKLLDIAESFTAACFSGYLGKPINVVWCGRLKTGPDNFVWEFLPVGVEHKDVWKLRDAAYNQIEPIVANAYVDVKNANFIIPDNTTTTNPYVKENSAALSNAIKISDGIWISPSDIRNFEIPSKLVLKDIQEFLFLIKEKFSGNGTDLTGTKNIYEWKLNNPISYKQLILYHSLIGNYNIVRAILAMDYVERFEAFIMSSVSNPVDFVKNFLGETSYKNIKINLSVSSDHAYISPSDGKLYVVLTDTQSTQPEGNGNTFGQKQIDKEHSTFTITNTIVSEKILTDDQIKFIHGMLKDQILSEFKIIKDSFLNLKTDFLHDSVLTGSNAEDFHQLENEFGIITTQDLIPFDQLRGMFNRIAINKSTLNSPDLDGKVRGAGQNIEGNTDDQNQSIFEKLVSNAQNGGVQFVKPGKEKVIIEEIVDEPLERTIRKVTGTDQLDISDIL